MKTSNYLPLVSIGVPVYNGGKYLEECLDSIRNQSYSNWECVISNNFSTDNTPSIAEEYVLSDPRFKLFHTTGLLPITENWNFCFSKINKRSDYFKILPADDWIYPGFLSEMVKLMEEHSEVGFCSSYRIVDTRLRADGLRPDRSNIFPGREILIKQLKQEFDVTSSVNAVLYNVKALKSLPYFPEIFQDESFHMDTYLSYEMLLKADLGFIFQVLSYTRRHEDTVTSKLSNVLNTAVYFKELVLFQYKSLDSALETVYRKVRIQYAFVLLKARILFQRDVIRWHKQRMVRPIKFNEYMQAVFRRIWGNKF